MSDNSLITTGIVVVAFLLLSGFWIGFTVADNAAAIERGYVEVGGVVYLCQPAPKGYRIIDGELYETAPAQPQPQTQGGKP